MNMHLCHVINCKVAVPPRMFMCRKHWFMVPQLMQDAIWANYRRGQEIDKQPSLAYLTAAMDAVNKVAEIEAGLR